MDTGRAAGDRRVRRTKARLREAFTALLGEKPLEEITVRELADRADVNRGTFYAHYTDIYDLLHQLEEEMMADFQKALAPLLEEGREEIPTLTITTEIFQCLKENSDVCTVTLGPFGDKAFAARLINLGREKYAESYRRFFRHATPKQLEYYYAFVSAGCIGLLEHWLAEGMTTDAREIARMAEEIMMRGLGFLQNKKGGEINKS